MWNVIAGILANKLLSGDKKTEDLADKAQLGIDNFMAKREADRLGILEKRKLEQEQLMNIKNKPRLNIDSLINGVFKNKPANTSFGGLNELPR